MSVGVKVGSIVDEVGTADFFHAFFSTISHHLEPTGWGSKFPTLMNGLYQGRLENPQVEPAIHELHKVRDGLKAIPPSRVVWDADDLSKRPPWGDKISAEITDLSNYFVTSTGRDLFALLFEALEAAKAENQLVEVVSC
jgi:hypothetical protein